MKYPSYHQMVEEILEVASEICNEWEYEFLESIQGRLRQGGTLSEKREDILMKLYKKACRSSFF